MKINKTLLKYEIANENGWLGPNVAIMEKIFICLFLYASKKDALFLQVIYSGKLSRAEVCTHLGSLVHPIFQSTRRIVWFH